jgi:ribonuclease HI
VKLKVFSDGGARGNPGPAAVGFIVIDAMTGRIVKQSGKRVGETTNNVAEYLAVIEALKFLKRQKIEAVDFFLDSQLVVNQLNGIFKIKDSDLRNLIIEVRRLENELGGGIRYHLIPRKENFQADSIVNSLLA